MMSLVKSSCCMPTIKIVKTLWKSMNSSHIWPDSHPPLPLFDLLKLLGNLRIIVVVSTLLKVVITAKSVVADAGCLSFEDKGDEYNDNCNTDGKDG